MHARTITIQSRYEVPSVAQANSPCNRNYRGLRSLAFAALLFAAAPAFAQSLGNAASFAILGGSAVNANGTGSVSNGDVGVSPGTSITGFPGSATVTPPFSTHSNDALAIAAQTATGALYTSLLSGACTALASDQLSGQNLGPGCHSGGALDLASTGTLTLSGAGVYIFRAASSLTANTLSHVVLTNGADACNVFWQVTSLATLNGVNFAGNVVAQAGVHLGPGATLTGRALATAAGDVTLAGTDTVGGCSAIGPSAGGVALGKAFLPATITASGVSTLTITLTNNNATSSILTAPLTDTLPSGMVVAVTPNASTSCGNGGIGGGVVTATTNANTVSLSTNSTIPGGTPGTCTMTVNVSASVTGVNALAIGALLARNGTSPVTSNASAASATLIVAAPIVGSPATVVPTLSEWSMIVLAGLLGIAGFAAMRRRGT